MKHLNIRYTIRLSDYLSNEMIKHTLDSGQDYSSSIRMCISAYLKNRVQNNAMSATKTHNSGVIDDVPSVQMFGSTSSDVVDNDLPFAPSIYSDFQ